MHLCNILSPQNDVCPIPEMYFRGDGFSIDNNVVSFEKNAVLKTSTYFNGFCIEKWKKYTILNNVTVNLRLLGDFEISLFSLSVIDNELQNVFLTSAVHSSKEAAWTSIRYPDNGVGMLYFQLKALSENAQFYEGNYSSDVDETLINPVRLAIGICTYKREKYIIDNLNRLLCTVNSPSSSLYEKVEIFISDNGQSLSIDELQNKRIHIFYNKNLGGAGGFTRCLIEAKKYAPEEPFTNFIFMDDDIALNTAALEKNFTLLALLKKEYLFSAIGGAMFSIDEKYLQFENGAKFQGTTLFYNLRDVDMRSELNVCKNELDYEVNYNAWCYCCIPFSIISYDDLPLPLFFHMDDVEYCLRHNLTVITLNGINVWHIYKKGIIGAKNDYYDVRNKLIIASELCPDTVEQIAHINSYKYTNEILKFHYERAINAFDAIIDFCKGFDYFKELDTVEKHKSILSKVDWKPSSQEIRDSAVASTPDNLTKIAKIKLLLRELMPSTKTKITYYTNSITDAYNAKKVIVYHPEENLAISYKKSLSLFIACFIKKLHVDFLIKRKLSAVVKEYNCRIKEVQNIEFWDKYLELTKE